jgi:Ca2+-transporting ATPase
LLTLLLVFGIAHYNAYGETDARALTFATLIVGVVSLIFVNRSWSRNIFHALRSPNRAFWWVVAGAYGFLAAVIYVPILRNVFRFAPLHPADLAICAGAGTVSFLLIELFKLKR